MTERPINLRRHEVPGILSGRQTQLRRVVKPQPIVTSNGAWKWDGSRGGFRGSAGSHWSPSAIAHHCPYGKPGDRLFGRETHAIYATHGQHRDDGVRWGPWGGLPTATSPDGTKIAYYREGFDRCDPGRWRSPIVMPRWASRILLEVTDVRVERVQDISEADAIAGGIERAPDFFGCPCWKIYDEPGVVAPDDPIASYQSLWDSIHGPGSWDANLWVWVIGFRRVP